MVEQSGTQRNTKIKNPILRKSQKIKSLTSKKKRTFFDYEDTEKTL
jgi:hypothetical protein